jgi:predicted dehydrogenase
MDAVQLIYFQFHWQFHPAAHLFREILDSKKYGKIIRTDAWQTGDIRWEFDLAGGSLLDCTYALSFTRYAIHAERPVQILSAVARPYKKDSRVDEAMHALLTFKDPDGNLINSRVYTDMSREWIAGVVPRLWELPSIEVETESAVVTFYNAFMPHIYHFISITDKRTGKTEYKSQRSGGPVWGHKWTTGGKGGKPYWSTYRWQLEAFMDKVRGKEPPYWVQSHESIIQMETIDEIYKAAGLPVRGKTTKEG